MVVFTYFIGLLLLALGLYGRFGAGAASWTALLPAVFGLALMTFGEGLRSLPRFKYVFLGLALIVAFVGLAGTAQLTMKLPAILQGEELFRPNGTRITPLAVYLQSTMFAICLAYIAVGVTSLVRWRRSAK